MSTPVVHNVLFANASYEVGKELGWTDDEFISFIQEHVGYYNYSDAAQAIRRDTGKIIIRRVTHFEKAKGKAKSNWHHIFSPDFLTKATEDTRVSPDQYHDAEDQENDVMGQHTDILAFRKAIEVFLQENADDPRAKRMAFGIILHMEIVDHFNDILFRQYVRSFDDGSIAINGIIFDENEKKSVFGKFKSLVMKMQEVVAIDFLKKNISCEAMIHQLNMAVERSYREAYSPWLAENTLKYVNEISFDTKISDEELSILDDVKIPFEELMEDVREFVFITTVLMKEAMRKEFAKK
jgi:hypothetical protein